MDHSAPMLASFEALPDMLTAKDLEAVLQIDRKTIYAYVQRGLIPFGLNRSAVYVAHASVDRISRDLPVPSVRIH